jgi:hypothetical protein
MPMSTSVGVFAVNTTDPDRPGYVEPRSTDPLHEILQLHINGCRQCWLQTYQGKPIGFGGMREQGGLPAPVAHASDRDKGEQLGMCQEYYKLIDMWATGHVIGNDE